MSHANMNQINFPIIKKRMIESHTGEGKCYLRLLAAFPAYNDCDPRNLEEAIKWLIDTMKSNPLGSDLITELALVNLMMQGCDYTEASLLNIESYGRDMINKVFKSCVRFGWEDINGINHVSYFLSDCPDDLTEAGEHKVYNQWGWSARFIICAMVAKDRRIGATIDLDDIFGETEETIERVDSVTDFVQPNVKVFDDWMENYATDEINESPMDNLRSANDRNPRGIIDDQWNTIESLNSRLSHYQSECERLSTVQKRDSTDKDKIERLEQMMTQLMMRNKDQEDLETILPNDSSSVIGRYSSNKQYMKPGTVFSVQKGTTVLDVIPEVLPLCENKSVVIGYKKTKRMAEIESKVNSKVVPINGLSNPFKSNRLNLLAHFHTAIESYPSEESTGHFDAMIWLSRLRTNTPSQELAKQIILNTFDLRTLLVQANPYKLPFIEIGMNMSDDALMKTFDLLYTEYKMLWFQELKSLKVPSFHSSYNKYKEHKLSNKFKHEQHSKYKVNDLDDQRTQVSFVRKKNTKSRSLLGF